MALQTIPSKAESGQGGGEATGDTFFQAHTCAPSHLSHHMMAALLALKMPRKPKPGANPASGPGGSEAFYPPKARLNN